MSVEQQVMVARQTQTTANYDHTGELVAPTAYDERTLSALSEKAKADEIADEMARLLKRTKAPWDHKMEAVERLFNARRKSAADETGQDHSMNIFDYLLECIRDVSETADENAWTPLPH